MLRFFKLLILGFVLLVIGAVGLVGYKSYRYAGSLSAEQPLDLPRVQPSAAGDTRLLKALGTTAGPKADVVRLVDAQLTYVVQRAAARTDLVSAAHRAVDEVAKVTDAIPGAVLTHLRGDNLNWALMGVGVKTQVDHLEVSVTVPYKDQPTHLNIQVEVEAAWGPGRKVLRANALKVGGIDFLHEPLIGDRLRAEVDARLAELVHEAVGVDGQNPLRAVRVEEGAVVFEIKPGERAQLDALLTHWMNR